MSIAEIAERESTDVLQFFEATPADEELHETRFFSEEGAWCSTKFFHRTSADLLEAISSQKMQGNGMIKISPTRYPILKCDKYPAVGDHQQYAYHKLIWSKEGHLKGYGYPNFVDTLQPGFYSIQKRQYEIKLMDPGYKGNLLRAEIVPELVLLIQPQYLSSFLLNFIVQKHRHLGLSGEKSISGASRFFEPQCSSLFINIRPDNVCLSSELNTKLHEFPWFSLKPGPPEGNRKFPKIFLDPDTFAVAT